MKKKKIIIIGATGSGYKRTIPALKDSLFCEVSAIQAREEEKLKKICLEYDIKNYYTDIQEILNKEAFDLIYIANPPFMHKETILACANLGKPIICEKPLARNKQEALEIKKIVQDKHIPIMVAHHLRHQKAFLDIKKMIENKEIGEIVTVFGQWGFEINPSAPSSLWKLNKDLGGGGTLSDNGIHVLDFVLGLFGSPNKVLGDSKVKPFKETYGNETMLLIYNDKDVILHSSHTMPTIGNHLFIYGTKGSIEIRDAFSEKAIEKIIVKTKSKEYIKEYAVENLYKNEVEDFIQSCLEDNKDVIKGTTLDEAIEALKLIDEMRKK